MNKSRKALKFVNDHAVEIIAVTTLAYVVFRLKGRRLVPIEGHFIAKADFQRLLNTDDKLFLMTPLGEFQVIPKL